MRSPSRWTWRRSQAARARSHAPPRTSAPAVPDRAPASALRAPAAQALCDLEANSNDLKAELRELYIVSAKEVDVTGRKAVVIFVPFKLLKVVHKIQSRLVREVNTAPHQTRTRSSAHARGARAAAELRRRCGSGGSLHLDAAARLAV